jgi:Sensors of blue-light using FAD
MIRLLYVSHASAKLTSNDTRAILEASRRFNPTVGITGVLVHGGGLFLQVLEGPEHAVLRLYTRLLDDKRHTDCRIVQISPSADAMFGSWSMGEIECDPLGIQHVNDLMAHRMESVQISAFTSTMRDFLRRLNAGRKPAVAAQPT